jgi:hypothetical protein
MLSAACHLDTIASEIPSWVAGDLVLRKLRSDVCKMKPAVGVESCSVKTRELASLGALSTCCRSYRLLLLLRGICVSWSREASVTTLCWYLYHQGYSKFYKISMRFLTLELTRRLVDIAVDGGLSSVHEQASRRR